MHGAGTKRDITITRDQPVLLDISRTVSRVGLGPATGIDRVERAYLDWCLDTDASIFLIARLASGYAVLDRSGALKFRAKLDGSSNWGRRDLRAHLGIKTATERGRAEADMRRLATSKARRGDLLGLLSKMDLTGFTYINVGHSDITAEKLSALSQAGLRVAIMIHDLIPRLYPELQRPQSVEQFEAKLTAIESFADLLIANSNQTAKDCAEYLKFSGPVAIAPLGIDHQGAVAEIDSNQPYFVSIGTIEPRKNYDFLLDIWTHLETEAPPIPHLHIIGRRGWADNTLFARLDQLASKPWFHEHGNLDDTALRVLLEQSRGLVYPTLAEGFGLPSVEAAALGVPVICGDLAIHRELLEDYPVYAPLGDIYAWSKAIRTHTNDVSASERRARPGPSWSAHFIIVSEFLSKKPHQG